MKKRSVYPAVEGSDFMKTDYGGLTRYIKNLETCFALFIFLDSCNLQYVLYFKVRVMITHVKLDFWIKFLSIVSQKTNTWKDVEV